MYENIDDCETRRKRCGSVLRFVLSRGVPLGIQREAMLSLEVLTASEMVFLPAILLTLFVYTEGNQLKLGSETLSGLSDQSVQLQDLISGLKLHLTAQKIKNNAESENSSRLEEISINKYHHGQSKNNEQQHKRPYLYTHPYIAPLPVRNQEFTSQSVLCTLGNSDLKNKYENFQRLGVTDRSIENIKESFTHSSKFQHSKENSPYQEHIVRYENIKFNNDYPPVNQVQEIQQAVSTEKSSQNVDQGSENAFYHNIESPNSYESQGQIQGIVSSNPFNYVKNINRDNNKHLDIQNIQSQEIPKQKYIFSWLPQNSTPDIKDFKKEYIMNRNKEHQHEEPQELKQSFYPEIEQSPPSPHYGNAIKIQNEYNFNKQLQKVPYNPVVIKYSKDNDHTQIYPSNQGSSHSEAIHNFVRNKNIDHIKEPQLQESETLKIVKKKALDIAQAKNQRPPIIIHRQVTITKHIPIPVARHANLTHSFQYKRLNPVKIYQYHI